MTRAKKKSKSPRTFPLSKMNTWLMAPMLARVFVAKKLFVGMTIDIARSRVDAKNRGTPKYGLVVFHGTLDEHTHDFKRALSFRAAVAALERVVPDGQWMSMATMLLFRKFKSTYVSFSVAIFDGVPHVNVIKSNQPPGGGKKFLNSHEHGSLPQHFDSLQEALDYCEMVTLTEVEKLCTCEAEKVL